MSFTVLSRLNCISNTTVFGEAYCAHSMTVSLCIIKYSHHAGIPITETVIKKICHGPLSTDDVIAFTIMLSRIKVRIYQQVPRFVPVLVFVTLDF